MKENIMENFITIESGVMSGHYEINYTKIDVIEDQLITVNGTEFAVLLSRTETIELIEKAKQRDYNNGNN